MDAFLTSSFPNLHIYRLKVESEAALAVAPAVQLAMLGARTDWAQEGSFAATEQILPFIRNGQEGKNQSQSATGLDIANNFSLWFLEDLRQVSSNFI